MQNGQLSSKKSPREKGFGTNKRCLINVVFSSIEHFFLEPFFHEVYYCTQLSSFWVWKIEEERKNVDTLQ